LRDFGLLDDAFVTSYAVHEIRTRLGDPATYTPPRLTRAEQERAEALFLELVEKPAEEDAKLISEAYQVQRVALGPELGSGTVPQVHEFGATVKIREARVGRKWLSGRRRVRPGQPVRVRSAKYSPRPFMGPALEAEKDHIPDAWLGSL
jgi:hypothetical protein